MISVGGEDAAANHESYGEMIECRLVAYSSLGYGAKIAGEGEQNETDCYLRRCDAVIMRKCGCAPEWSIGASSIE